MCMYVSACKMIGIQLWINSFMLFGRLNIVWNSCSEELISQIDEGWI